MNEKTIDFLEFFGSYFGGSCNSMEMVEEYVYEEMVQEEGFEGTVNSLMEVLNDYLRG